MPVIVSGAGGASEKKIEEIIKGRGVVKSVQRGIASAFSIKGTITLNNSSGNGRYNLDYLTEIIPTTINLNPVDINKTYVIIDGAHSYFSDSSLNCAIVKSLTPTLLTIGSTIEITSNYRNGEYSTRFSDYKTLNIVDLCNPGQYMKDNDITPEEGMELIMPSPHKVSWQVIEFY